MERTEIPDLSPIVRDIIKAFIRLEIALKEMREVRLREDLRILDKLRKEREEQKACSLALMVELRSEVLAEMAKERCEFYGR